LTGLTLDHVGIAVIDLNTAAAQFKRLGFQLTPRGYHTLPAPAPGAPRPRLGTGNHCAMFRRGYVELIGIVDPLYDGRLRADLERYQGLHIVAFATDDAVAVADRLRAATIDVVAPRTLERPIEECGKTQLARFEIVDFPATILPEGHFFAIRHATPDLLWKPALMNHPNGVESLEELTIAVDDPPDLAHRLERVLAYSPRRENGLILSLAAGRLRIVGADWLAACGWTETAPLPCLAGICLGTKDLGRTVELLSHNSIDYQRLPGTVAVGPRQACGAFVEFRQQA
jgi:hypothetical protein